MSLPMVLGDELTVSLFEIAGVAEGKVIDSRATATSVIRRIMEEEEQRIVYVTSDLVSDELIGTVSELGAEAAPLVVINSVSRPDTDVVDLVDVISTSLMEMVETE